MSLKSKAKAKLKREHLKRQQLLEVLALDKGEQRLKSMTAGFSWYPVELRPAPPPVRRNFDTERLAAKPDPVHQSVPRKNYEGVMLERELLAQKEIHEKKKLVMPLGNKMGLQYPTSEDLADFKAGKLRRR